MCVSSEAFAAYSSTSGIGVLCEAFEGEACATTRTIWSIEFILCETFATSRFGQYCSVRISREVFATNTAGVLGAYYVKHLPQVLLQQ